MFKRTRWFALGAASTVAAGVVARRQARRLAPDHVAHVAIDKVRDTGSELADAARVGRDAMRRREAELRDQLDRAVPEPVPPTEVVVVVPWPAVPAAPARRVPRRSRTSREPSPPRR